MGHPETSGTDPGVVNGGPRGGMTSLVLPRLVVSSTRGGGGKTLLSLGLARAFAGSGRCVLPFKKGPDYIDAAWLAAAAGHPSTNLDPFFCDADGLRAQTAHAVRTLAPEAETPPLALIEGNRGLFDGLDAEGTFSTATLARTLSAPVLLSLNVTKQTRTAAALLQGIAGFEKGLTFAGVVLNATGSPRHASAVRAAVERYTDFRVLGELPRLRENPLPERHMGLASLMGDRLSETAEQALDLLADHVRNHVDLDEVARRAGKVPPLEAGPFWTTPALRRERPPVIAYVRDACLWFYYRENLEALERAGARLVRLSLLEGDWPLVPGHPDCPDGLYLGGGFPEDHAEALSKNPRLRDIARLAEAGMPVYAECGGFMTLCRSLGTREGIFPMAGILPMDIRTGAKPRGLGYVHGSIIAPNPFHPKGMSLRGHEFHYSWAENADPSRCVLKLTRGTGLGGGMDGLVEGSVWGSYTHIFAPAVPSWAGTFCDLAEHWRDTRRP